MGASGGFPIDLVLFGMIAAFLVLRLRSILGKRTGFERPVPPPQQPPLRPNNGPIIDVKPEPVAPAAAQTIPDTATPGFLAAIQGFIDHEVGHILFTDWSVQKTIGKDAKLHSCWNIIEDPFIEHNRAFHKHLEGLDIAHEYSTRPVS